jgi:hypothetical protein
VANQIFGIIEEISSTNADLEIEMSLEHDVDGLLEIYNEDDDALEEHEQSTPLSSQETSQEWESFDIDKVTFTHSAVLSIVEFYDKCKKNKFAQTNRRYPKVKYNSYINRFKKYLLDNGTTFEKFKKIEQYTMDQFEFARARLLTVSDRDLKRWGLIKAREINCKFVASDYWVRAFKIRNRIVSRKITKYFSNRELNERKDKEDEAAEFAERVKNEILGVPSNRIFNFDQSGFTYEFAPNRTLSHKV